MLRPVGVASGDGLPRTIVVGTDGSDTARQAVDEAVRWAKAFGAELHVVTAYRALRGAHVSGAQGSGEVSALLPDDLARPIAEEAASLVRGAGVSVHSHLLEQDPGDAILETAARVGADLIVVGSQGMSGARRVLGSVPNKISHAADCNVMIVSTRK
jgi:nucleotide-binding universal stress UspA family protein